MFCERFIATQPEAEAWVKAYREKTTNRRGRPVFLQAWVRIPQGVRMTPRKSGGVILSSPRGRTLAIAIWEERDVEPYPCPWMP
jgi:hypothetical protein